MFNPAMAWPAAQLIAIRPPANIHQFTMTISLSPSAALLGNVAEAEAGWRTPVGGVLEFDESGIGPATAMRFECGPRQSVVAELDQRASAVRFEQELYRRLPGHQTFHTTPGEHHFFTWD